MSKLFRYIMYHLWEWRHRNKPKFTNVESELLAESDRLRNMLSDKSDANVIKRGISTYVALHGVLEMVHIPEKLAEMVTLKLPATARGNKEFSVVTMIAFEDWDVLTSRKYIMDNLARDLVDKIYKEGFIVDSKGELNER